MKLAETIMADNLMGRSIWSIEWPVSLPANVWVTKDGRHIKIEEMEIGHLRACIKKVQNSRRGWRCNYLARLLRELDRRAMG